MKEYSYPDFMPKKGGAVFVRDNIDQEWRKTVFDYYAYGTEYPWVCGRLGWRYAAPYNEQIWPLTPYTKDN